MISNRFIFFLCCLILLSSCKPQKQKVVRDFDKIKEEGELTIATLYSSTSYFIYKDEPMGYDYEIAQDFCKDHNLTLKVKVADNITHLIEMIQNGEADLATYAVPVQNDLKDSLIYCGLSQISHQVLVQRANKGDTLIKNESELIGKEVHIIDGSKYEQRLHNFNEEIGGGIIIKEIEKDTVVVEDLIQMVSEGKIRYTLCDEYIARLNKTYYRNIDISIQMSFDQRNSWITRKDMPLLAQELNKWVEENKKKPLYKSITKKYFELGKLPLDGEIPDMKNLPKGSVSPYDEIFKKYAEGTKYEWQLLAAISYHESRFQNNLTSWAGAAGIMGLMPRTAKSLGLSSEDRMNPELSIEAAVVLLDRLDKIFAKTTDLTERKKLILAAYNGGNGHINDAQALARKYGADPNIWEGNVKKFLELKNNPDYFNDPVVKCGYFRSGETVNYVSSVLKTTERFKRISAQKK